MNTEGERVCRVCGMVLPEESATCPVCVFRGALHPEGLNRGSTVNQHASQRELRFEHYQVLRNQEGMAIELGRGGMGVTYKALDTNLRYAVALKVIDARLIGDESARRRFVREARAAASVRHPNVASVFHLGKAQDCYFFAMEFVEGESLDKIIRRLGRLQPSLALKITALIATGLEAIDKQNLVHRDIKPGNVMVSLQGDEISNVKIIDLGLVKGEVNEDESISALSTQGIFVGTPAYASPEQFDGLRVDRRSDLYSLGVTLWGMLLGEVPFHGSFLELYHQHQHSSLPIEKLNQIPRPVVILLDILLEKDPSRRFQTPTEFRQAISIVTEALDSGQRVTAEQLRLGADAIASRPELRRRFRPALAGVGRRFFGWWIALALCVVGLLLLGFIFPGYTRFLFNLRIADGVPSAQSIAVLPFESLSESKSDAYFADGVQDEILNNLSKIAQLRVISRTSVMQYRTDTKRDLRQIANVLGVTNVLEGTVRRDGDRVRVSTELIDARNDNTIWADSYDRELTDIFAIQSEVAQTIARKLAATLSSEEKKSIEAKPTENLEAYDLYLRAKELIDYAEINPLLTGYEKPLRDAINLLDQAVQLDPKFALAYCAEAYAHDDLYWAYDPTPNRRTLGDTAVNNALRLQPDLPEVRLAYATHLYRGYRDYDRARVQLAIARRGMPNNTEAMLLQAFMDRRQGNFEEAIQELKAAITLDPRNPMTELPNSLIMARQFSAAEDAYDRAIDLAPDHPILKVLKAHGVTVLKTGDDTALRSALAALPVSMAGDRDVVTWRLRCALYDRDWHQAIGLVEQLKGGDAEGGFAYMQVPVPAECCLILIARLQGQQANDNSDFAETREQLNQRVQKSQADGKARLLTQLAVVDALLGKKQDATAEGKRAVEMLPISKDAVDGPNVLINLAVVYAWTGEPDLAFETLSSLTKTPNGIYYGYLKLDPTWDPIRKDPRFEKLLSELAP